MQVQLRSAAPADIRPGRRPEAIASRVADRLRSSLEDPGTVLPLLLILAFAARVVWLDLPQHSLIFDEAYYVNAARILLGWSVEPGAHYAGAAAGLDPNMEHPPLGKLVLAGSMLVFGDNGLGWRIPSVIAGMTALAALYGIVRAAGETAWMAILAVGLLAFDNLTLVHSRIGTLDMLVLAPILVGAWLALRDRWALAGIAIAFGLLIKLTAIYALVAVLTLLAIRILATWRENRRVRLADLRPGVTLVIVSIGLFLAGLWALDVRYTTYASPIDHVAHMVEYGTKLRSSVDRAGICATNDSAPWEWPFNECQITYLRVDVTVRAGETIVSKVPSIDFRGALNPLLAGAIPLAVLFAAWLAWRTKSQLARWAIVWAAANYLPYVVLAIVNHRITYIYYFLPVIPAIAVAVAILLLRAGLPRFVLWGFLVSFAVGFAAYFPFRTIP
ncbi:MAG TPA: glycosyltransferase family 39 protein [Candidatus Limnocylindrales bacterium]|nr:glycosyltransferase family 39 protein [Candidatus Limnocylindrales bacterium]